eukprot:1157578-Pelagomonas_calceolata.AAC.1
MCAWSTGPRSSVQTVPSFERASGMRTSTHRPPNLTWHTRKGNTLSKPSCSGCGQTQRWPGFQFFFAPALPGRCACAPSA